MADRPDLLTAQVGEKSIEELVELTLALRHEEVKMYLGRLDTIKRKQIKSAIKARIHASVPPTPDQMDEQAELAALTAAGMFASPREPETRSQEGHGSSATGTGTSATKDDTASAVSPRDEEAVPPKLWYKDFVPERVQKRRVKADVYEGIQVVLNRAHDWCIDAASTGHEIINVSCMSMPLGNAADGIEAVRHEGRYKADKYWIIQQFVRVLYRPPDVAGKFPFR